MQMEFPNATPTPQLCAHSLWCWSWNGHVQSWYEKISCNPVVNLFIFTRPGNTICLQGDFSFQANLTKKMNLSSKCEKISILGHESWKWSIRVTTFSSTSRSIGVGILVGFMCFSLGNQYVLDAIQVNWFMCYGRPVYGTAREADSLWMAKGNIWNGPPFSLWSRSICSRFVLGWPQRCQPQCCNCAGKGKVGALVRFSPTDGGATI